MFGRQQELLLKRPPEEEGWNSATFLRNRNAMDLETLQADPYFLWRCALNRDWDRLVEFSTQLSETFTSSVTDRFQDRHEARLRAARQQLLSSSSSSSVDDSFSMTYFSSTPQQVEGQTVLHLACQSNPPVRVIHSLLDTAAVSAGGAASLYHPIPIHATVDRDGKTPLQVACAHGASLPVIQALLDFETPSASNGATATNDLLSSSLSGASLVNHVDHREGRSPLSELGVQYSLQQLELVLQDSLRQRRRYHRGGGGGGFFARTALPLEEIELIGTESVVDTSSPLFYQFWAKVKALIRVAWSVQRLQQEQQQQFSSSSSSSSYISILHGAAHVAGSVPCVLTSLICRCYPHMVSFTDHSGWLPLHLALQSQTTTTRTRITTTKACHSLAANGDTQDPFTTIHSSSDDDSKQQQDEEDVVVFPPPPSSYPRQQQSSSKSVLLLERQTSKHSLVLERQLFMIRTLLELHPDAAGIPCPGGQRSTLCTAIAAGLSFHNVYGGSSSRSRMEETTSCHAHSDFDDFVAAALDREGPRVARRFLVPANRRWDTIVQVRHNTDTAAATASSATIKETESGINVDGPLKLLFKFCPSLVCQRDAITGFFPFALAAAAAGAPTTIIHTQKLHTEKQQQLPAWQAFGCDIPTTATTSDSASSSNQQYDDDDKDDALQWVDTVYNLLRVHPHLLEESLIRTRA